MSYEFGGLALAAHLVITRLCGLVSGLHSIKLLFCHGILGQQSLVSFVIVLGIL